MANSPGALLDRRERLRPVRGDQAASYECRQGGVVGVAHTCDHRPLSWSCVGRHRTMDRDRPIRALRHPSRGT